VKLLLNPFYTKNTVIHDRTFEERVSLLILPSLLTLRTLLALLTLLSLLTLLTLLTLLNLLTLLTLLILLGAGTGGEAPRAVAESRGRQPDMKYFRPQQGGIRAVEALFGEPRAESREQRAKR
jgi:hypothetical protein